MSRRPTPLIWRPIQERPKAHPLIRQAITLLNEVKIPLGEVLADTGVPRVTFNNWGYKSTPVMSTFDAFLNGFGYKLAIVPQSASTKERLKYPRYTLQQNKILEVLVKGPATMHTLCTAIDGGPKLVGTQICKIRKLLPKKTTITFRHGDKMYYLDGRL